ncbi:MAG: type II toxin-antitoxin system RelE/ParE family toxin [Candidatus Magnetobacterium sp. LHC-1]
MKRYSKDLHEIIWTDNAIEGLEKLDRPVRQRILKKVTWLKENFEYIIPEKLMWGISGTYKLRVGDWRLIYVLMDDKLIIHELAHRSEIYDLLRHYFTLIVPEVPL